MPKGLRGFQKGNKLGIGNKVNCGRIPWNKGKSCPYTRPLKPKVYRNCSDCGKLIHKYSIRCLPCSKLKKYRNPNVRQKRWAKKINGVYLQSIAIRIRDLKEYAEWRINVFKRDGFICQSCQGRGLVLHAHHIKYMSTILVENKIDTIEKAISCHELWDLKIGITLCQPCHKLAHGKK